MSRTPTHSSLPPISYRKYISGCSWYQPNFDLFPSTILSGRASYEVESARIEIVFQYETSSKAALDPQNSFEKARWSGFLFSIRQLVNFTPISGPFMSNLSIIGRASLRCQISSIQQLKGNLFSKRSQRGKTTFAKIQKRKEKLFLSSKWRMDRKRSGKKWYNHRSTKGWATKRPSKGQTPKTVSASQMFRFSAKKLGVNKRRVSSGKGSSVG